MATDLTKRGIRIAKAILFNPEDQWLADEHLSLMFDIGLFSDADQVLKIIEDENAHELIPIIAQSFMMSIAEEMESLKGNC